MSGKALTAGRAANLVDQKPAASTLPLTYFSNDANGGWIVRESGVKSPHFKESTRAVAKETVS